MDVKLPNGKIIRGVPEGTTKEQIQAKAIASGLATEQDFAPAPTNFEDTQTATQKLAGEQSMLDAALISTGRGINTIGAAAERLTGFDIPGVEQESPIVKQSMEDLSAEYPVTTTVGEVVGETLPFLPAGIASGAAKTFGGRVGGTAGLGFIEGGASQYGKGENLSDTFAAAGLGGTIAGTMEAAIPVLGRVIGKTYRELTGKTAEKILDANGQVLPPIRKELEARGVNVDELTSKSVNLVMQEPANLDEAARIARFRQQGIPYTPGDITQDFTQRAKEARLSELQEEAADPLRDLRTKQASRIAELKDELTSKTFNVGEQGTGEAIREGVELAKDLSKGNVRNAYKKLAEKAGMNGGIPLPKQSFEDVFSSDRFYGQLQRLTPDERRQLQNTLVEFGIDDTEDAVNQFLQQTEVGVLGKKPTIKSLTTENAEEFTQAVNGIITPTSSNELRAVAGQLKGAADSAFDAIDSELAPEILGLAKEARKANIAYKQDFSDNQLAGKIIKTQRDRNTPLVENSKIFAKMFSKATPIEQFDNTVGILARTEKGKQAISAMQGQAMLDILDSGFIPSSRMNGQQMFSGNAAQRQLERVGNDKIERLFFSGQNRTPITPQSAELYDDFMSLLQTGLDITPSSKEMVKGSGSVIINALNQIGEMTMMSKLGPIAGVMSVINKSVREGKDAAAIKEIIKRSPRLKKEAKYISENLPQISAALGLTTASAATKAEEEEN